MHPFGKVMLESGSLHASLSKLVCRARCRRKSFDPVALRFGTFTDDRERRCLTRACDAIEPYNLLAAQEDVIDCFALCPAPYCVIAVCLSESNPAFE